MTCKANIQYNSIRGHGSDRGHRLQITHAHRRHDILIIFLFFWKITRTSAGKSETF